MVGTAIAVASLAVSAGSAVASHQAGKKAAGAQMAANEAQRKITRLRNQQAKRQYLRQFRQAQAATITNAIAAGVGIDSSAFRGTLVSQERQRATAVQEFNLMDRFGGEMTAAMQAQSRYNARANTFAAIGSFAQTFISFPTGGSGISEIDTSTLPQPRGDNFGGSGAIINGQWIPR